MEMEKTRMYKIIAALALALAFLLGMMTCAVAEAAPEDYPKMVRGKYYETERALLEDKYPQLYHDYYWDLQEMLQYKYGHICTGDSKFYGYNSKGGRCFSEQRWAVRSTAKTLNIIKK